MLNLVDIDQPSLEAELREHGFPPSHALPVLRHFYRTHGRPDFGSLSIGHELIAYLHKAASAPRARVLARTVADDGTAKLLIGFDNSGSSKSNVEAVLMPSHRPGVAAACVSSQIGCAMGCDFCASTRGGLERNLSAGEMVEQFLHLCETAAGMGRQIKTLVFMGMGEPMLNLDAVAGAIRCIGDPLLGGVGWRQITVSTVGIVPAIDRLASMRLNVHLALSLHAPDDETRTRLVPSNRRYPVAEVLAAAARFYARTRRVPTIEYCLLAGVNDSNAQAALLAKLLAGLRAHVNVIPYNAIGQGISGIEYARPSPARVERFVSILRDGGAVTHVRQTRGDDASAACGQLRQRLHVLST